MEQEYKLWLIDSIDPLRTTREYYQDVIDRLYERDFVWSAKFSDDENRAIDGLELRDIFAKERGVSLEDLGIEWKNCSCLEMMIGLARRIEFEIISMPGEENIPKWFWMFMENLGLGSFKPDIDSVLMVDRRITNWLNRKYYPNGYGGIFSVRYGDFDMRKLSIWKQMTAVLNEELEY